ncbi:MAG: hypothetical protein WAS21_18440 [Geminicoccaceae bacterium]
MNDRPGDFSTARPPAARPSAWLAVPDAAKATGWNPERLRSLARRGTITSRRGNRGLEILIEDGRARTLDGQPQPDGRPTGTPVTDGTSAPASDQHERIRRLEATIDALRDELAGAERDTVALRLDLVRAEERVKAVEAVARGDVEAAKRVVEAEMAAKEEVVLELRAQVAREIGRSDSLARELAEARHPWWRRLLG